MSKYGWFDNIHGSLGSHYLTISDKKNIVLSHFRSRWYSSSNRTAARVAVQERRIFSLYPPRAWKIEKWAGGYAFRGAQFNLSVSRIFDIVKNLKSKSKKNLQLSEFFEIVNSSSHHNVFDRQNLISLECSLCPERTAFFGREGQWTSIINLMSHERFRRRMLKDLPVLEEITGRIPKDIKKVVSKYKKVSGSALYLCYKIPEASQVLLEIKDEEGLILIQKFAENYWRFFPSNNTSRRKLLCNRYREVLFRGTDFYMSYKDVLQKLSLEKKLFS